MDFFGTAILIYKGCCRLLAKLRFYWIEGLRPVEQPSSAPSDTDEATATVQDNSGVSKMPTFQPMRLARRPEPFDDPDWIYEIKFDGFRALAPGFPPPS